MADWLRNIEIDPHWRDYRLKLTNGWVAKVERAMPSRNRLQPVFMNLVADLRAATYTANLPFLMTSNIVRYHEGHTRGKSEPTPNIRVADAIARRLVLKLRGQLPLSAEQMAIIHGACLEIKEELKLATEIPSLITHDKVWGEFLEVAAFRMMAWGSQRFCFVAFYSAFEDFLVQAVAAAIPQPTFKRKPGDAFDELGVQFGADVYDLCWKNHYFQEVRLARNAISHFGGRETDTLRELGHTFSMTPDKLLQIKASDNATLIGHIEKSTEALITAGSSNPVLVRERRPGRRRKRRK